MRTHWIPYDVADPRVVGWPPPMASRRVGRLARAGTLALAAFVVWLVAGRAGVAPDVGGLAPDPPQRQAPDVAVTA